MLDSGEQSLPFGLLVLRFYGPVNTIKVILSQSINISTLFLGRLPKQLTITIVPILLPETDNCPT